MTDRDRPLPNPRLFEYFEEVDAYASAISLFDLFAAAALAGLCARGRLDDQDVVPEWLAKQAWRIAVAMLEARTQATKWPVA